MLQFIFLITTFTLVVAGDLSLTTQVNLRHNKLQPRIWGGATANRTQFPYQVGLKIKGFAGYSGCGGALISRRFILTAAHCVYESTPNRTRYVSDKIIVYLGMFKTFPKEHERGLERVTIHADKIIPHPSYDYVTDLNDIALIELPTEITLNRYIQVINLPPRDLNPDFVGKNITLAGWGQMGDKNRATKLRFMITKGVPVQDCIVPNRNDFENDKNICVNTVKKSACKGDSGGPNIYTTPEGKQYLIGVTSHLVHKRKTYTCKAGMPQVLTRVSFYLEWIHSHTGISI